MLLLLQTHCCFDDVESVPQDSSHSLASLSVHYPAPLSFICHQKAVSVAVCFAAGAQENASFCHWAFCAFSGAAALHYTFTLTQLLCLQQSLQNKLVLGKLGEEEEKDRAVVTWNDAIKDHNHSLCHLFWLHWFISAQVALFFRITHFLAQNQSYNHHKSFQNCPTCFCIFFCVFW